MPAFVLAVPHQLADGEPFPSRYTRQGENVSPPLSWSGTPPGTESLALFLEGPDAHGTPRWHWSVHGIPPDRMALPEDLERSASAHGLAVAVNDLGNARYDGPCPPLGEKHRYVFHLLALGVPSLGLPPDATAAQAWAAAREHMLAETELVGTYSR